MSKSFRKPTASSTKETRNQQNESKKNIDIIGIIETGINAIDSINNIISTIGEEMRKTEELRYEGIKINAEIKDRISERENETAKILKEYEINLKNIEKEMLGIETQSEENIKNIELKMEEGKRQHEYRMRGLDIIEKIVDVALEQYRFYMSKDIAQYNNILVINIDLIGAMNGTIQQLTAIIAQANIGGSFSEYNVE